MRLNGNLCQEKKKIISGLLATLGVIKELLRESRVWRDFLSLSLFLILRNDKSQEKNFFISSASPKSVVGVRKSEIHGIRKLIDF